MAEDDFGRWERELRSGAPEDEASGGRGMALVAGAIAVVCAAAIARGAVPLGAAGLVLSSIILLLWRAGM